jgi:23S rRNA (cytidine1920-2'-O)/16S rRNA (cytidine1409-2'-O)-methyltransferase
LEKALDHWQINLHHKICLDVGASTGGFSDCMLQHGAAKVIAIDTGYGQMDFGLRNDPRMRLLEKTNARYLQAKDIAEPVAFIAMDVSFISATQVLPAVIRATKLLDIAPVAVPNEGACEIVVLVKPQFEVGRELVGKGGIVRDETAQQAAVAKVETALAQLGCLRSGWIESPILGGEGNREFLLHAEIPRPALD